MALSRSKFELKKFPKSNFSGRNLKVSRYVKLAIKSIFLDRSNANAEPTEFIRKEKMLRIYGIEREANFNLTLLNLWIEQKI